MRTIILIFFVFATVSVYSQSSIEFTGGSNIEVQSGADICAGDIIINGSYSGNGSLCGSAMPVKLMNITVIPEAFYNTGTGRLNSKDTIRAFLRNSASPYAIVDSAKAVTDSVSFTATFNFPNAPSGNYYFVIKHRNSLETWSRIGGESYTVGVTSSYDFTNDSTKAYGNNMVKKGTLWCLISGDVNQDGVIDASDRAIAWNERNTSGYKNGDVNGDMIVDATDRGIIWNYRNRSAVTPGMLIRKQNEIITNDNMEKEIER